MQNNEELTNRMGAAWTSLGNLIGPIIEKVVGWITTAIQYLTAFLKLLGVTGSTSTQTGKATEKAAAGAKKGVEELKRTLAGFDELEVMQDNSNPQDQSAGTSAPATLPEIEPPDWLKNLAGLLKSGQFEEFGRELARMLNKAIASVDWADLAHKVSGFFLGVLQALYGAIDEFDWKQLGQSIKTFFQNIQWDEIRQQIFDLLKAAWKGAVNLLWGFMAEEGSDKKPPLIKSLENLGKSLGRLYTAIDSFIKQAWESSLKPVLEWTTGTGLPWIVDRLKDGVDLLSKTIEDHGPLILGILESIGAAVLAWDIGSKVLALVDKIGKLWAVLMANPILLIIAAVAALVVGVVKYGDEIKAKLQELDTYLQGVFVKDWKETFGPILGGVLNSFFKIVKEIWGKIKTTLDGIIDFIKGVFSGDWERAWTGIGEILSGIFGALYGTFAELVSNIVQHGDEIKAGFQAITDFLQGTFSKDWTEVFGPVLGEILNGFFANVQNTWDSVKSVLEGIIDFVQGVFTLNWSQAWTGVREVFAGIFSGMENILKAPINGIISLINGAIAGINNLIDGANRLGSVVGFSIPYLNEIPYLAKGGILKKGQIGLLEGDGTEAVVPLEKNTEWIAKVAEQLKAQLAPLQNYDSGNAVPLNISEALKEIAAQFKEQISPTPEARQLAALQDIADTVAFRVPSVAGGAVLPYSIQDGDGRGGLGDSSEVLDVLERIEAKLDELETQMDNKQVVLDFGSFRAFVRKITKEQRQMSRAEGN